jgi:hypothetical protein
LKSEPPAVAVFTPLEEIGRCLQRQIASLDLESIVLRSIDQAIQKARGRV